MSTTSNTYSTQGTQDPNQKTYVQQAYDGAASLASTAAATVQSALGSTAFTGTTDPTTQYRNKQPHVGGVGDLGTTSEADVTRLPEERANPDPFEGGRASKTDPSLSNPALSDPATIQSRLNAREPPTVYPEVDAEVGQYKNKQLHTGGVGDLGTNSASDVARLPEERANPDPLAAKPGAAQQAKSGITSAKDTLKGTVHDVTAHGHSGGLTGSNADTDHGLGMPHREGREFGSRDQGAVPDAANAVPGATNLQAGAYQDRQAAPGIETVGASQARSTSQDDQSGTSPTNPSKMDKLKGKFHIMKGKLTKDDEEIKQGVNKKTTGEYVDPTEI